MPTSSLQNADDFALKRASTLPDAQEDVPDDIHRKDGGEEDAEENAEEDDDEEEAPLAKKESKAVSLLRLTVLSVLTMVALAVSLTVFWYTRETERDDFESAVTDHANKVMDAFQFHAQRRVQAVEGFSQDITSHAIHSNSTWP